MTTLTIKNSDQLEAIRKMVKEAEDQLLQDGIEHGSLGIALNTAHIERLAEIKAAEVHHLAKKITADQHSRLEESLNEKELHHSQARVWLERTTDFLGLMRQIKWYIPNSFSRMSGVMFLIFGFYLLLGDIPLSVELISAGFNFHQPDDLHLRIYNLFSGYFFAVLGANWQVFLTAAGISVCTVAIKLCYDVFIGHTYGSVVLQKKRFYELFDPSKTREQRWKYLSSAATPGVKEPFFDKSDQKSINKDVQLKKWFFFSLLAITLLTVVVLGIFRTESMKIVQLKNEYTRSMSEIPVASAHRNWQSHGLDSATVKLNDAINAIKKGSGIFPLAFILIAILFALMSGVCFSVSISVWQNKSKLNEVRNESIEAREESEKWMELVKTTEGELAAWKLEKALLDDDNWIRVFTGKLTVIYKKGHALGTSDPGRKQKIPSMMVIVDRWVKRVMFHATLQTGFNTIKKSNDEKDSNMAS